MLDQYVSPRREAPLHTTAEQRVGERNTPQNNDLQPDAGASNGMQQQALPSSEEFTISVEQVRDHFRAKGLNKSKDTVQRWCRTGELACQKRGVLGRYFTTETSLLKLELKLLPDMIAEQSGTKTPVEANAPLHAAEDAEAHNSTQQHAPENAVERSGIQPDVQLYAAAVAEKAETSSTAETARLAAEVEGLRAQLDNRDKQIEFLHEEIRSAREQRSAVVQISNRMLETLETMAIGGRLDRHSQRNGSSPQSTDPLSSEHRELSHDGV